jgi:hypothetical protein
LQSDGVDLAKRRSGALSVGEPRWTALSSGDTAVLCCCTGSLPRSFRHRLSVWLADLVRLAAIGWRRPKCGVEYELPKLIATVSDHSLARWFSLGETRIKPSQAHLAPSFPVSAGNTDLRSEPGVATPVRHELRHDDIFPDRAQRPADQPIPTSLAQGSSAPCVNQVVSGRWPPFVTMAEPNSRATATAPGSSMPRATSPT